ncbi:MAG: substrate-binding periplasmic protein [Oligoflexales bacterium]
MNQKKVVFYYLNINVILACILSFLATPGYGNREVKLALENSSDFPYVIGNSENISNPNPGLAIEILNEVAKKVNIKIKFKRFPWNRCLHLMEKGIYDGCFSASYKKEREKLGVYPKKSGVVDNTKRLMDSSYILYTRPNSSHFWTNSKLSHPSSSKLKIVTLRGFSIKSFLEKEGAEVHEVDKLSQALNMVKENRVDGAALIDLPAEHEIRKSKFSLTGLNPPLKTKAYFLMFSHQFYKGNKSLAESIWKNLEEIRDTAFVAKLKDKYFSLKQ